MRVLVTGGTGFVGKHLVDHLVSCGDSVAVGYNPNNIGEEGKDKFLEDLQTKYPKSVQFFGLDVTDVTSLTQAISIAQPDAIYHLAAITFVPEAEKNVTDAYSVNTFGTINLLEAVKNHSRDSKVLVVSTSEVYGIPRPGALPVSELSELRPHSVYGASKAAADLVAQKYAFRDELHIVRARPFPHIGPGQSPSFAMSSFSKQLAEIKLGKKEPCVTVGNLDAKRDYSDVSDIVRGYREALLNGKAGEVYNLCFGESHSIGELLEMLKGVSGVPVEVKVDDSLIRNIDIPDIRGSYEKASKAFGWKPRVEIKDALAGLYGYWLEELG